MGSASERKRIRKKVIEILKEARIPNIGESVFSQRSVPTASEDLPVINVYVKSESVERFNQSPKTYKRNLQIELEINTVHNTDDELSDELDDLSQSVEDALEDAVDILFAMKDSKGNEDLINDYDLLSALYDIEGAAQNPYGSVRMIYDFEYFTDEDRPKILPDLKSIKTTIKVNGREENDATDIAEFE